MDSEGTWGKNGAVWTVRGPGIKGLKVELSVEWGEKRLLR